MFKTCLKPEHAEMSVQMNFSRFSEVTRQKLRLNVFQHVFGSINGDI
jgi:hypothetical protein